MEKANLYKIRALDDFAQNFESLRRIEWRLAYQSYAGYAAIALAYSALRTEYAGSPLLAVGATAATLLLFITTLYASYRVQERLHYTRGMQNLYLKQLHGSAAPRLEEDKDLLEKEKIKKPGGEKWWAFKAQLTISIGWLVGLVTYIWLTALTPQ